MAEERFVVQIQASLTGTSSRLRAIAANALDLVGRAVEQTADDIIQELQDNYETAVPGETYERTGNLGDEWQRTDALVDSLGRVTVVIFNDVTDDTGRPYSSLVQGPLQTHRHDSAGWKTIEEVQKNHAHAQSNRVRAAIRRAGQ